MTLSMTLLAAGSYLLAITTVWFSLLRMRKEKSIRRGLPLWSLSLIFAVVASYAFGQVFLFVPDFISHINAIVLLGYFAVEFLLYKKMRGGRTQIYCLILLFSFLVACMLVGGYFLPAYYHPQFYILIKIPILLFLSYVLVYIWPTFIQAYLRAVAVVLGVLWTFDLADFFFPRLLHSVELTSLPLEPIVYMSISLLSFFFIVAYLIALDTRMYLPAMYYFNKQKAWVFVGGIVFVTAIVGSALTIFDAWSLLN